MAGKETALAKTRDAQLAHPLEFSNEQVRILAETIAKGCDQNELAFFLNVCKLKRLDPFGGQVHCVKRWDSDLGREKMAIQVGIEGFRVIAARTEEHAGTSEAEFDSEEGQHPNWARVTVYRYGRGDEKIPYTVKARYSEYVVTKKDGNPNRMWATKPYIMLSKCAESAALRKAFPDELSGMYSDEEMGQADNEGTQNPPKAPVSMPKSTDEKPAQTKPAAQPAQAAPPAQTAPKPVDIAGVIEKTAPGKGRMEGCLFLIVDQKVVSIPKEMVTKDMEPSAKIALRATPNSKGNAFQAVEIIKVEPEIIDAEVIEEQPDILDEARQHGLSGLFDDEPQQAKPQTKMEPDAGPSTAKKGTIGTKRAQRLYALRGQNEKQTNLTEAKLREIMSKLPIPIEHLSDLETSFYGTFEQIVTGEEDWRPYLD